jgi:hypothetical protein
MTIFGDVTRQRKFLCLWDELMQWDKGVDMDSKKIKLVAALRQISERPVDDMDWTPNTLSLQEVHVDEANIQAEAIDEEEDRMDID